MNESDRLLSSEQRYVSMVLLFPVLDLDSLREIGDSSFVHKTFSAPCRLFEFGFMSTHTPIDLAMIIFRRYLGPSREKKRNKKTNNVDTNVKLIFRHKVVEHAKLVGSCQVEPLQSPPSQLWRWFG